MFTTTGRFQNCMRIGCGHAWSARIEHGLIRLGQLCASMLV
jgi:DNA-binding transcriptional MocR family regulator